MVQQLVQKGFYESRVFVLHEGQVGPEAEAAVPSSRRKAGPGGVGGGFTEMALQLHRDYVALVYEGRERIKGHYEGSFQVVLAPGSAKAFTLQVFERALCARAVSPSLLLAWPVASHSASASRFRGEWHIAPDPKRGLPSADRPEGVREGPCMRMRPRLCRHGPQVEGVSDGSGRHCHWQAAPVYFNLSYIMIVTLY